ncbi:MAG: alpha/beta hydrolase [Actinobacteria bacterium]|nr:alpha/beta hydrolase [Actinomycetota bacterium]
MYLNGGGTAAGKSDEAAGPPLCLLLTEPARGLVDLTAFWMAMPWLVAAPRGDGHGVLVWPGLLATDTSTVPLRQFVRWLGYDVLGWNLGRNRGPTQAVMAGLPRALMDHTERTRQPVTLIGWSLGGVFAREMARRHPGLVRQVITLGSPFAQRHPRQSHAYGPYQRLGRLHVDEAELPSAEQRAQPVGVPSTSVYSRWDGVVSWRTCIEPETRLHQNVEVRCSHLGFGVDPATLWLIADRLAVPAGQRIPFRPPAVLRPLYPGRMFPGR